MPMIPYTVCGGENRVVFKTKNIYQLGSMLMSCLRWRLSAAVALSITRPGPDVEEPNASAVSD